MRHMRIALFGLLALATVLVQGAGASPGTTERVSVDSAGNQGNDQSSSPAMSGDGRFGAFISRASNLVAGDTNVCGALPTQHSCEDVFVHDRQTGATERVSVDSAGNEANGVSFFPSISADGRFVAFGSVASNLVAGDTNICFGGPCPDVFVHDRETAATERVSVDSAGVQGNNRSDIPDISADGRFVAFQSRASNLVAGDTNVCFSIPCFDVFVHDRETGATERVSVDSVGNQGNGESAIPSISGDGHFVAFRSRASNLVSGDTNGSFDVFVHDRQIGATTRVSVDSAGNQASGFDPDISSDGRFVVFWSSASNLVAGDTNGLADVFVHDRQTGATERVSVDSAGNEGNSGSGGRPSISGDGRFVAFTSFASNLVAGDTNGTFDIFVHDRQTGVTERVSVDSVGDQANGESDTASISGDGRFIAFSSEASNLVAGDTNTCPFVFLDPGQCPDVFLHDLGDLDGDGEWDPFDNCPSWPNADQSLPPWPIPADDPDCDGFTTAAETFMGTLPQAACAATPTPNDEDPDSLPTDFDDDQDTDVIDVLFFKPHILKSDPDPDYSARFDFDVDGDVDIVDVLFLKSRINTSCAV